MSRQFFKIFSLALLAIVVVWGTMAAQKTPVAAGKAGGNQDIPLKAVFTEGLKITNDLPYTPYVHQGTQSGQNQILISQPGTTGRFLFVIYAASSRWVNLYLDNILVYPVPIENLPPECDCLHPYFIYPTIKTLIKTTMISISTTWECQYISPGGDGCAELIPVEKQYLNFANMSKGQTKYVCGRGNVIQFRTTDDPTTKKYDESQDMYNLFQEPQFFVVKAGDWDGDGVMDWILTPFAERFKAKDNNGNYLYYDYGCVPRRVTSSSYRSCDHGTFLMPFELKIARLK